MEITDGYFLDFHIFNTHPTMAHPLVIPDAMETPFVLEQWEDPVDHFAYTDSNRHSVLSSGAETSSGKAATSPKTLNVNPNNYKPSTTTSEAAPMPGFFKRIGNTMSNLYNGTLEVVQNLIERMIRGFNRLFGKATVESVAESAVKAAAKIV